MLRDQGIPEEQFRFGPDRSTTGMMFLVPRLREIGRKVEVSLFMCFIDLQKASGTVDRTLPWQVFTQIGVPPEIVAVIRLFHHSKMRACMQFDDGVCSDRLKVDQCLWQEYVLSLPLFSILFVVVLTVILANIQLGYWPPRRGGTPEEPSMSIRP